MLLLKYPVTSRYVCQWGNWLARLILAQHFSHLRNIKLSSSHDYVRVRRVAEATPTFLSRSCANIEIQTQQRKLVGTGIKRLLITAWIFSLSVLSALSSSSHTIAMVAIQLLAGALFASAALATPSNSRLGARLERRRDGRQSQLPSKLPTPSTSNNTQDTYTSNWAGAVWESYPSVNTSQRITLAGMLTIADLF